MQGCQTRRNKSQAYDAPQAKMMWDKSALPSSFRLQAHAPDLHPPPKHHSTHGILIVTRSLKQGQQSVESCPSSAWMLKQVVPQAVEDSAHGELPKHGHVLATLVFPEKLLSRRTPDLQPSKALTKMRKVNHANPKLNQSLRKKRPAIQIFSTIHVVYARRPPVTAENRSTSEIELCALSSPRA